MCGLGRLVFPAVLVGVAVASIAGSAAAGWLAAAAVAAVLLVVGRRGISRGCGVPQQQARPFEGLTRDDQALDDRGRRG